MKKNLHHSSFIIHHSSFILHHSSLIIHHSSFIIQLALLFTACCIVITSYCHAEEDYERKEYYLKAGFIYNFAKLTEWADDNNSKSPIVICVMPQHVFKYIDYSLNKKVVRGRQIKVMPYEDKRILHIPLLNHIRKFVLDLFKNSFLLSITSEKILDNPNSCHIVFIGKDAKYSIEQLEKLRDNGILTIGDDDDFVQQGGIIGFFKETNRLRFRINIDAVKKSGLKLSSQLLMSAERYKKESK